MDGGGWLPRIIGIIMSLFLFLPAVTWAAHPLLTDDSGTQGKGRFQLEVNGQYDHDQEAGAKATGGQARATLSFGIVESADLILGLAYVWGKVEEDGTIIYDEKGMAVLGPDFRRISLLKVPLTYSGFASSLMVLTSKKLSWRFSHEDRTSHS